MKMLTSLPQITLIQILLILAGAWLLILFSQRAMPWAANRFSGRRRLYLRAMTPLLRLLIIAAAAGLIVPRVIEPTFENLVALLGALGLALGFAFKDYVGSLIAGIVTLFETPYRVGDWIAIDGTYGEVRSIGMRALEIVTPDDTVVVIPHLKLWDHMIFNANDGSRNLQCAADFFLASPHNPVRVIQILHDVGLTSAYLQVQRPVAVVASEQPWGTRYRIKAYPVDPRDQFQFITDLTVRGKIALAGLGVRFAQAPVSGGKS